MLSYSKRKDRRSSVTRKSRRRISNIRSGSTARTCQKAIMTAHQILEIDTSEPFTHDGGAALDHLIQYLSFLEEKASEHVVSGLAVRGGTRLVTRPNAESETGIVGGRNSLFDRLEAIVSP